MDDRRTATEIREDNLRLDRRRIRATSMASVVLKELDDLLGDDGNDRVRREAHDRLMRLFLNNGVEVLTDSDRAQLGLPLRRLDGWTEDELRALDALRLELLTPKPMVVPGEWVR